MERLICLAAGYDCGCLLTAEVVARWKTGRGARTLGSGNPGMANIAGALGKGAGALVLAGDLLKTALACALCRLLLAPDLGRLAVLYAGLGAALGHNFPFWSGFHGGKGVTVTCAALVLAFPLWGTVSCILGLAVVLSTGYLPVGALVIPAAAVLPAFWLGGAEAGMLVLTLTLMMLSRHIHGLTRVARGQEPRKFRRTEAELEERPAGSGGAHCVQAQLLPVGKKGASAAAKPLTGMV